MTISIRAIALSAAMMLSAAVADAATYSFTGVTNNNATNTTTGQNQLSVDVLDLGSGNISFTFANSGPLASSIADVYWDDRAGVLGTMGTITASSGVSFSQGAAPPNLPGGNSIGFSATASADSNPPVQPNGVNPGEWLTIVWSLISGATYADVIAALNLGGSQSGSLRIGLHVQGFANGGSESFVNNTPAPVPVPAAGLLLLGALGGLAAMRGKKRTA